MKKKKKLGSPVCS